MQGRISRSAVVTGTISYPPLPGVSDRPETGVLVYAKAALEPDTPWEVLNYATSHTSFPNDPTGDQWFEHDQFDAYQALGRHIGRKAAERMRAVDPDRVRLAIDVLIV